MRKILLLALVALTALANTSCGDTGGVNLTDAESVRRNLPGLLEKHVDPQAVVTEISFMGSGDFVKSMDVAVVRYFAPGSDGIRGVSITLSGGARNARESRVVGVSARRTPDTGVKLADVDFSKIASNIAKGVEIIAGYAEETGQSVKFDGIGIYRIELAGDPAGVMHKFSLESRAGAEMSTARGRLEHVTNYYTFEFEADADGNVTHIEED